MLPAAILVLVTGLLAPIVVSAASLQEQVSAAYAAWDAAFSNGDPKAVAAFYTKDAVSSGVHVNSASRQSARKHADPVHPGAPAEPAQAKEG
jgi:hypothetical protein